MNSIFGLFKGYCVLQIQGASPERALNGLVKAGIAFWNVEWIDVLTLHITVFPKSLEKAHDVINSSMCESIQLEGVGFKQRAIGVLKRPVVIAFLLICVVCAAVLPRFVLFYQVIGNDTVPADRIIREINKIGIGFGTYGPNIRPHWVKNRLLQQMPELQWVTITQNGCRATIVVRERNRVLETESKKGFANVVALESGIITKQSVMAGQAQFQVGDTVQKGDVLVSGIVDLERIYVLENAKAEIFARTWRKNRACIPVEYTGKTGTESEKKCIWLVIGDTRIKIFGNSGISYDSCDKMKTNLELALPGELNLPVSLEIETFRFYEKKPCALQDYTGQYLLEDYICAQAEARMIAGEILQSHFELEKSNGLYILDATLECHEMIAKSVPAKWKNEEVLHD